MTLSSASKVYSELCSIDSSANILCGQLLFGTLLTQTHIVAGGGGAEGGEGGGIVDLTFDMMGRLPQLYDVAEVAEKYPVQYYNSMNTVLKQVFLSQSIIDTGRYLIFQETFSS